MPPKHKQPVDQSTNPEALERALALRPLSDLRLKSNAFDGNVIELDSDFISDKKMIIPKKAIRRRGQAERLTLKTGLVNRILRCRVEEDACRMVFDYAVETATEPAELLGYFDHVRPDPHKKTRILSQRVAVAVTAADQVFYLGADAVRFIFSAVSFDALKVPVDDYNQVLVVFVRQGQPVAVLAPLRWDIVELPIDIAVAREQAQRWKSGGLDRTATGPVGERDRVPRSAPGSQSQGPRGWGRGGMRPAAVPAGDDPAGPSGLGGTAPPAAASELPPQPPGHPVRLGPIPPPRPRRPAGGILSPPPSPGCRP